LCSTPYIPYAARRACSSGMLTADQCRARAADMSRLAAESTDEDRTRRLEAMSEDWAALAATVAEMEHLEARFISEQDSLTLPQRPLLN